MDGKTSADTGISRTAGVLCRGALIAATIVYTTDAFLPQNLSLFTGWLGLAVIITGAPLVKKSYRRPALVFIILSLILVFRFRLPFRTVLNGINSMISIAAIMTALQIFLVPIRAGGYDKALERYLKGRFGSETPLYIFVSLIAHIVGSFMLFGTVPMLYTFFGKPINEMVHNPKRFAVTAIGRSFTLVTLWAPGAVSVVLVLESTGADWLKVLPVSLVLMLTGFITSFAIEGFTVLRGRKISVPEDSAGSESRSGDNRKIITLVAVAVILLAGILVLDLLNLLTGSVRVIIAGLIIALVWTLFNRKGGNIGTHLAEYWNSALNVVPDLAVLFMSMGIFTKAVQASPFMDALNSWVLSTAGTLGPFSFLIATPFIVILSLTGIHPFMGVALLGTLLSTAMPAQSTMIALGLLLGSAVSYSVSPFAGTLITLSRFAGCSPAKAAFSWNGLFSLLFFAEGLLLLSAIAAFS